VLLSLQGFQLQSAELLESIIEAKTLIGLNAVDQQLVLVTVKGPDRLGLFAGGPGMSAAILVHVLLGGNVKEGIEFLMGGREVDAVAGCKH
jgi:hypothetical protein